MSDERDVKVGPTYVERERAVAFYYNVIMFHRDVSCRHNDDAKYQHLTHHSRRHIVLALTALLVTHPRTKRKKKRRS